MNQRTNVSAGALLGAAHCGFGLVQLAAPATLVRDLLGVTLDRKGARIVRVLGARHVIQGLVCGRNPSAPVLAAGAVVDALHAVSILGLAARDKRDRPAARASSAIAGLFAFAGALATVRGCATSERHQEKRR